MIGGGDDTSPIFTQRELAQLDGMLCAAQLLCLRARGYARDYCKGIDDALDPLGQKLDAFRLGVLDGLRTSTGTGEHALRLLVYLLQLSKHGPGAETVVTVERTLANASCGEIERYAKIGRLEILRLLAGESVGPQSYADLLLAERVSHKLQSDG